MKTFDRNIQIYSELIYKLKINSSIKSIKSVKFMKNQYKMEIMYSLIVFSLVLCQTLSQSTQNGRQTRRQSNSNSGGLQFNDRRGGPQSNECSRDYSVDYLILALQWPTSFCVERQRCNRNVDHNRWQIHGLWPQRRQYGQNPQFCCLSNRFDYRLMDPIRDQLLLKWKSVREDAQHEQFWRHEWNKHGSCAQRLSKKLSDQFQYFNTTLGLYDLFPINDWFKKKDIHPNNDRLISVNKIHDTIESQLKARVRLECGLNPDPRPDSPPILSEIHLCLDRNDLKPIDCKNRDDRQCFNPNIRSNSVLFPKH